MVGKFVSLFAACVFAIWGGAASRNIPLLIVGVAALGLVLRRLFRILSAVPEKAEETPRPEERIPRRAATWSDRRYQ